MWIAEVHGHPDLLTQFLVHRHLSVLAIRHAQPYGLRNAEQLVGEGLKNIGRACGLGVRQLDEHQQPAGALDQRAYGAGIGFTFDQVALPMPRELPVLNLRWPHMNAQHVGNLAASVLAFAARCSFVVGLAQTGDQFLAQLSNGLGVDAVVDRLV